MARDYSDRVARVRRGFTLVEMLVVVAVVVVLIALLLPSMRKARYNANIAVCASNLRQVAVGHASYAMDHRAWLPFAVDSKYSKYYYIPDIDDHRWMMPTTTSPNDATMLRPYLGDKPMNSRDNEVLHCPQAIAETGKVSNGNGRWFYYSFFANRVVGQGGGKGVASNKKPFHAAKAGSGGVPPYYTPVESRMLQRMNDTMFLNSRFGADAGEGEYDFLASDWALRGGNNWTVRTNHVWGGEGASTGYDIRWSTGDAIINFAFVDGSVRPFQFRVEQSLFYLSIASDTEGTGGYGAVLYPAEWKK